MAIVAYDGFFPRPPTAQAGTPTLTSITVDAADEGIAMVGIAPKAGNIQEIGFYVHSFTSGSGDFTARIESISAGALNGIWASGTGVTALAITGTGWMTSGNFTNSAVVTRDSLIGAVVKANGTPNLAFRCWQTPIKEANLPYMKQSNGSGWQSVGTRPIMALKYDDGTYEWMPDVFPAINTTPTVVFDSGTTPDEVGLKITLAFGYRIRGIWCWGGQATGSSFDAVLYDESSNVLETKTFDPDDFRGTSSQTIFYLPFDTSYTVPANTTRRIVIKPSSTNDFTMVEFESASSALTNAFEGGTTCIRTERTDGGSWTDTNTKRPQMGIWFDGIDVPAGGGLLTHPGMAGGVRG